ncbi:RagB/SusD family nutrient uptake outer membrane protein [Flavobacterium sp. 3HN19-14]|uniref:RagB/SusD family nutrient uptake outer membrane protein n=1 Tax=Flavobacterium sp. 3HN19-14 TaxID=3448133 RepID=UPI003EE36F02
MTDFRQIKTTTSQRNSVEEVYAFIIADLQFAGENLPASYGATDVGRATKGAAKGFLAKVYMYQKTGPGFGFDF